MSGKGGGWQFICAHLYGACGGPLHAVFPVLSFWDTLNVVRVYLACAGSGKTRIPWAIVEAFTAHASTYR